MLRSLSSSSDYIFSEEAKRGRTVLAIPLHPFLMQEWPAESSRNIHHKKQDFVSTDPPSWMWAQCSSASAQRLWDLCWSSLSCSACRELALSKGVESWAEVMLLTEPGPFFSEFSTLQLSQTCKTISLAKLLLFGACRPTALCFCENVFISNTESHTHISSPMPICFQNIFHWIRERQYSTKYNPKMEAVYYND